MRRVVGATRGSGSGGRSVGGAPLVFAVLHLAATGVGAQTPAGTRAPSQEIPAADARRFWLGVRLEQRDAAAQRLLDSDIPFGELYAALRADPAYPPDPPTGRRDLERVGAGGRLYPYTVLVPPTYDPARAYPVLFYLHGGVARPAWTEAGGWWRDYGRISDPDRIVVAPAAWSESSWWHESQIENLDAILRRLGREYRIDRNRVHVIGISDGGSGVYYQAFRAPTPWASFLAFIGHPAVLSSPRVGAEGQMYVTNLRNRPLFLVNGGRDRLYPTRSVEPFITLFREHDVPHVYRPQPEAGHDLGWLGGEAARIDSFIAATPRDPLPDRVEWESEAPGRGRFAWIVIDELGAVDGEATLPERNDVRLPGDPAPVLAFPHPLPSGRVVATREGNTFRLETTGVRRLRVLVSPDEIDLERPLRVEVNGRVRFDGVVTPSAEVLLRWAARDEDRTMLFAAELSIEVATPN